ncbi:hypothetical protein ACFV4F_43375 [Kitasatospora sp. NPDC059722]|uniref:hypothetical protein n=1 Tax=unclassified Kitasatospora TaxID=2633591 RepID=UPI0036C37857
MRGRTPRQRVHRRRLRWWQRRSHGTWWTIGLTAVLGVGMLASVVRMERQYVSLERHGVHTTATIAEMRTEKRSTGYLIHFAPAPRAPADIWTRNVSGGVGGTVAVVYDPADPGQVMGTDTLGWAELLVPGLLGTGGAFCLVVMWAAAHDRSDQCHRCRG